MDTAVDYTVEVETAKQYDSLMKGEETYLGTAKSMAKIGAAQSAYYGVKDVIDNIPAKDDSGVWLDPRQRFEVVADAQGMEYLALAGYDAGEAGAAWRNVRKVHVQKMREKEQSLGPWAAQLRETESMMRVMRHRLRQCHRLRQSLGASGLVQTISDIPPSRADLVADFTNLKEVRGAPGGGKGLKNTNKFQDFIKKALLAKARKAFDQEDYDSAYADYKVLYEKGIKTSRVVYGMAKSSLGDFAFGATEGEKKKAEKLYREAASMDRKYAEPYRGLGELYDDWERYDDAVKAYRTYLKLAPKASDGRKIERKIKALERKAVR
jgi:tetratricopeptide (TPR) repeat protein